ncbi:MAG: hypothetical protein PHC50_09565 [Candidatus Cloacimonetes bacterium]|nr:hypothetical protein [Candidatus Cloacimonadota bacterium]
MMLPERKNIRLRDYDYTKGGAYFITICCHNKECLFGDMDEGYLRLNQYGNIVHDEWIKTRHLRENIILEDFIVMPNHFHGIIILEKKKSLNEAGEIIAPATLGDVVRGFKTAVTVQMRKAGFTGTVWQRGYYDHIIRNQFDSNATVAYIIANPTKWVKG